MSVVYVDESGDLGYGRGGSRYLTIACVVSPAPRVVNRIVRKAKRQSSIPTGSEIKKARPGLRSTIFRRLAARGCTARAITVKKENVHQRLRDAHENVLYNYMAGSLLLDLLSGFAEGEPAVIVLDRRTISARRGFRIDDYLRTKLWAEKERPDIGLTFRHEESHVNCALQAAHLVARTVFRKYEVGDNEGMKLLGPLLRH